MQKKFFKFCITLLLSYIILINTNPDLKMENNEEDNIENKITQHLKKLGFEKKNEFTKEEFITIFAKFIPFFVEFVQDSKELRNSITKNVEDVPEKIIKNDLSLLITNERILKIIKETIQEKNKLDKNFEDEFDKIDEEFKSEL